MKSVKREVTIKEEEFGEEQLKDFHMLIYQINQTVKQTRPDVLLHYYELASVFHHATVVDILWSQLFIGLLALQ